MANANNDSKDTDIRIIIDGLARLKPPTLSQSVHREECTQCFDTQVRSIQSHIVSPSFTSIACRRTTLWASTFV